MRHRYIYINSNKKRRSFEFETPSLSQITAVIIASTLGTLFAVAKFSKKTYMFASSSSVRTLNWNQIDKVIAASLIVIAMGYLTFGGSEKTVSEIETVKIAAEISTPREEQNTEIVEIRNSKKSRTETKLSEMTNNVKVPKLIEQQEKDTTYSRSVYRHIAHIHRSFNALREEETKYAPKARIVTIDKGDTLAELLINKAAVSKKEAFKAVTAIKKVYDPRNLIPGHDVTVFFKRDPRLSEVTFKGISIEKDLIHSVSVTKDSNGKFRAQKTTKAIKRSFKGKSGVIKDSLYLAAKRKGLPEYIIIDLIRMFSWNVDFQREIRTGDTFEVLFEEYKTEDGKTVKNKGNILYAKLNTKGESMPFYRFKDKAGFVDYYNDKGRSAKKTLMRTPIDGARLTSGFGRRKHPVLGYSKIHKGVDFAAPVGTPIYASGDGIIEKIQRWSSFGNYIRIKHRDGLKTAYAHMKNFKRGLKKGHRVKQGAVIGYLGNTGRTTGPHLHYEVIVHGKQMNPRSLKLPAGSKLKGNDFKKFQKARVTAIANYKNYDPKTEVAKNLVTSDELVSN